eukprot:CAMPEP_0180284864 /NCGR_PEP_ID=MMETSP0988-20121125/11515_1 /TAXON_ID=697907 /ORGANISM="non described non described, Strain CCMP2293" /LENGTH=41 /DNA_ID= /DNA_START= /DNA_END= /DNA_ORIENTATION=
MPDKAADPAPEDPAKAPAQVSPTEGGKQASLQNFSPRRKWQ